MESKKCPDCQGELTQIKLVGRGWENPLSRIAVELVFFGLLAGQKSNPKNFWIESHQLDSNYQVVL